MKNKDVLIICLLMIIIVLVATMIISVFKVIEMNEERQDFETVSNIYSRQLNKIFEKYNHTIRNPSYIEVWAFMHYEDATDTQIYIEDEYVCRHFAYDFIANATVAGFRCGFVTVIFQDDSRHAIVVFDTERYGLIFIEPQDDSFVDIGIGLDYYGEHIIENYFIEWSDDFL